MQRGFQIGRIFGINIRLDWSWFFIFLLITWNLGAAFGQMHPDWGGGLVLATALSASLLFFGSVLAHELAHAVTARSRNIPVKDITLFLFGGVSNIQREPPSPKDEFLITIVGPLTSLVLGGLLLMLGNVAAGSVGGLVGATVSAEAVIEQLNPLTTLLLWLGSINIILGLFNLVPGFPLDGGRILRSILWSLTGNLRRATRWASWVGQAVAGLLILSGIAMIFGITLPFFGTGFINGLWLIFIGWFLNGAAWQSYRRLVVKDMLEGVPVTRIMISDPPTVPVGITLSELVDSYVMRTDDHAFPVVQNGDLYGMVTLDDIRSVPRSDWDQTSVNQIMTPVEDLVTIEAGEDAVDALDELAARDIRQIPVLRNGHLTGLLRRRDLIRWLQFQSEEA